jgi:hypothetical protein
MTIRFNCPKCGALIAFADKHAGKRARCLNCRERFTIPSKSEEKPGAVAAEPQEKLEPMPGFYRAVFIDGWRIFTRPRNVTGLVFVAAAVCFKFFVGHTDYSWTMGEFRVQGPVGLAVTLAAWGCLFWYYTEIICSTAFDVDDLPDVDIGGLFGFIWNVVKSLSIFAFSLVLVELPCIIFLVISKGVGFESSVVAHILAVVGLFVFPMAILTLAVAGDMTLAVRPDYLLKPIVQAFWPYFAVVALFVLTWELQLKTLAYGDLQSRSSSIITLHLTANLAVQGLAILSMRSIGLFYRHYGCYFKW